MEINEPKILNGISYGHLLADRMQCQSTNSIEWEQCRITESNVI